MRFHLLCDLKMTPAVCFLAVLSSLQAEGTGSESLACGQRDAENIADNCYCTCRIMNVHKYDGSLSQCDLINEQITVTQPVQV